MSTRSGWLAAAAFALIVVLACNIAHPSRRVNEDQSQFHYPTILKFAHDLPWPDLRDYAAASAPGYHLVMAVVARFFSGNLIFLRIAASVFGLLFVGALTRGLCALGGGRAAWLVLPVMLCVYVVTSAGWLLPEDAGYWLLAVILCLALTRPIDRRFFAASTAFLAMLIFTRQSMAWVAAPMWAAAAVGDGGWVLRRRVVAALLATLPATAVLISLFLLWHGLVPPSFQAAGVYSEAATTRFGGHSPGSALMTLALIGLYGVPLAAWFWRGRQGVPWLAAGAAIGLLVALALPSDYQFPQRRSGIWTLALHFPTIHHRSLLMIALATCGGAIALLAISSLHRRAAAVLGTALVCFIGAQMANPLLWQRYFEPVVLIWLSLAAAVSAAPVLRRLRAGGLVLLTTMQLAALIYFLLLAPPE